MRETDPVIIGQDYQRQRTIRTVAGAVVGIIAAIYAFTTGESAIWLVALVAVGIVEPTTIADWLRKK